jgi:hypothetical protein
MPRGNKKRKRTDKARGSRVSLEVEDHTQDSGTRLWKTGHGDHLVVESGAFSDDEESVVSIESRKLRTMKKSLSLSPSNKKQRVDSSTPSTPVPRILRNKGTLMDLKSIDDLLDDTQDNPASLLEGLQQALKKLEDDYHLEQLSENSSEFRDQRNRKLSAMASLLNMIYTMFQSGVVELSVEDKLQLEESVGKMTETQTDTSPRGRERIPDIIEPETPDTRGQARPPRSQTPSRRSGHSGSRHSSERHRVLQEAIVFPGEAQYTNGVEVASNNSESSRNPLPNIYNDLLRPNPPTILSIDRTQSPGTVVEDPFLTTQQVTEFVHGVYHTMNAQHRMRQNPQEKVAWKKLLASMMDSLDDEGLDSEIDKPLRQESQSFLRRLWRFWHLSPHTTGRILHALGSNDSSVLVTIIVGIASAVMTVLAAIQNYVFSLNC